MSPISAILTVLARLVLLSSLLWVVLRLTMPGEEKVIAETFRRRRP